jgi:hypothetical protein
MRRERKPTVLAVCMCVCVRWWCRPAGAILATHCLVLVVIQEYHNPITVRCQQYFYQQGAAPGCGGTPQTCIAATHTHSGSLPGILSGIVGMHSCGTTWPVVRHGGMRTCTHAVQRSSSSSSSSRYLLKCMPMARAWPQAIVWSHVCICGAC